MKQRGFTLMELMIVVAIIGILAAIALPAFNAFQVRSRLSEAISGLSTCKLQAIDFYLENAGWDREADGANISTLNLCDPEGTTYIQANSMQIENDGTLVVGLQNLGNSVPDGAILTMSPVLVNRQIVGWTCGNAADGTTIAARFRPGSCQG